TVRRGSAGSYFFSYRPLQMKIVGAGGGAPPRPVVAFQRGTVIVVRDAACVAAARRYWDVARRGSTTAPRAAEEPSA
ncbi:hypothetical protein, partial [Streptomyces sp. KL116D]|uniref:hypothetical protein n=1 Tax=Streptomyces sp. KL116D TaxID=3045152 RepID=UPI0035582F86